MHGTNVVLCNPRSGLPCVYLDWVFAKYNGNGSRWHRAVRQQAMKAIFKQLTAVPSGSIFQFLLKRVWSAGFKNISKKFVLFTKANSRSPPRTSVVRKIKSKNNKLITPTMAAVDMEPISGVTPSGKKPLPLWV